MFRPLASSHRRPPRRGTSILLIALIMLTLFSAVGIAYVFFAIREARQAQARKEEQTISNGFAPPSPTDTVNRFLGTFIYGTSNDGSDLLNPLRGHELFRAMYGGDYLGQSVALGQPYSNANSWTLTTPWAGVGMFQDTNSTNMQRTQQINYTLGFFNGNPVLLDPEYSGERTINSGVPAAFATTLGSRNYIGKHAPYTYPDLNNFHLAALDPATGQVMLPSFHRPALFGSLDPNNGGAASNNWTNAQGRFKTLRPRPAEHPSFPRVPPDADGVYRGDVQNWPGGYIYKNGQYYAMNDSLWMNIGLPPVQFGNKKVVPLVAPLIIPIDGVFNASAHGNTYGVAGGPHFSYAGYGPWEVNFSYLLGTDAATVVNGRGALQQRNGTNALAYAPYTSGQPLPNYSPVAWANAAVSFGYPTGNSLTGLPLFNNFQNTNQAISHPSLFNPTEWPGTSGSPRTYPLSDLKRLHRFGFTPNWYDQADLTSPNFNLTPNSLQVSPGFRPQTPPTSTSFNVNLGSTSSPAYGYRLDPNHLNRALLTPRSYGLDRVKSVPSFLTGTLQLAVTPNTPYTSKPAYPATTPYPAPQATGPGTPGSDFAAANRWSNIMAALGSLDLNRQLTDYRQNTGAPLTNGNITNVQRADWDRRKLAHDIFVRLAAATGAGGITINMTGTEYPIYQYSVQVTPATNALQYNALIYLAQLAVNIVDYIDNDDISTVFVWNPTGTQPGDPNADQSNFTSAQIGLRVVFGHEKSRLVINEAYGEIVNDPADPVDGQIVAGVQQPPTMPLQARFWLELLNPTTTLNPGTGPLGNGSVSLSAYQIQIRRETRLTDVAAGAGDNAMNIGNNQYAYLFGAQSITNPAGSFNGSADATFTLAGAAVPSVMPSNGTYAPGVANLPQNGIVLVGPPTTGAPKMNSQEFTPDPTLPNSIWVNEIQSPAINKPATQSLSMGYQLNLQQADSTYSNVEFKRHIVLLRRAANPYLTPNDPISPTGFNPMLPINPYVTVDLMDYVPAFDAVHRGKTDGPNRGPYDMTNNPNGYVPVASRFSIGKVQPYAGHAATTAPLVNGVGTYNNYGGATPATPNLSVSMVQQQMGNPAKNTPQTPADGTNTENAPFNTFGRHNGLNATQPGATTFTSGAVPTLTDTIMLPYDWLVHMDRPLVNQIELFQVRDTPPYRVTDQFVLASAAPTPNGSTPGVTYDAGVAQWRFVENGLTRALEYLTVKPYTAGVPHGGRVPGQINLNVVTDPRVIQGLFDPQAGNVFDGNYVNNTVWSQWMATRTSTMQQFFRPNGTADPLTRPVPSASVYDGNGGTDVPFLSFGAPAVAAGGAFAYTGGQLGTDLTILRRPTGATNPNAYPYLYATKANSSAMSVTNSLPDGPSYMQAEPVRKILNNSTTVSHTYLVFLTIGYFEADTMNPITIGGMSTPKLGAEAYITVPGDLRQKYVAVIDMSNMALDATTNTAATVQPFFTSLTTTAYAGTNVLNIVDTGIAGVVAADGFTTANITAGQFLVLGHGTEQQVVQVSNVAAGQITLATPLARTAWGGSCVSNVRPGYPGVQSTFDYTNPMYQPVVPYVERLR